MHVEVGRHPPDELYHANVLWKGVRQHGCEAAWV
jgi:hypothetical protein